MSLLFDGTVTPIDHHSALDVIDVPFNKIEVTSQLAVYLPCRSYEVSERFRGAYLLFRHLNVRYAIPITVLCSIPYDLRSCLLERKVSRLIVAKINARLSLLGVDVIAETLYDARFLVDPHDASRILSHNP